MTTNEALAKPRPNMTDVARHAGVALGTVSNVLNNPEKVSERTRRKVSAAIAELGYIRNDAARSLAAGQSTTVGLVVADLGNSFFVDIARGTERLLRLSGMNVLIANTDVDPAREVQNLELFERSRVAGILFAPLDTPLATAGTLPVHSTPTVLVNAPAPNPAYAGVAVDEIYGGSLAAQHLLDLGRRRFVFVGGPMFLSAVKDRYTGVAHTAAEGGATVSVIETTGLGIRHGRVAAEEISSRDPYTYDAIMCASDLLAIGVIDGLRGQHGFDVPGDLLVTGYDDNHFASESAVPITTVSQPGEEMGRAAAELLLQEMSGAPTGSPSMSLRPHLIPRRSTLGGTA